MISTQIAERIVDILELFDHLHMADLEFRIAVRQDTLEEFLCLLAAEQTAPTWTQKKVIARLSEKHAEAQSFLDCPPHEG
jgi:uncharacterized coiled-coil protein SlyX